MDNGWEDSAPAWIETLKTSGDFAREHVLDPPMLERVRAGHFLRALDVGCGEGRFCRLLQPLGVETVGIDPTKALLDQARRLDPAGDYRPGRAEALDFPNEAFDLVVSYLTLIDIPDITRAIAEMARVLKPGGSLLIANLTSFNTAGPPSGWTVSADGKRRFEIDNYMDERAEWIAWKGVRIQNWHRPLSTYMRLLLDQGLVLRYFDEPMPRNGDPERIATYRRVPFLLIMEWQKPEINLRA